MKKSVISYPLPLLLSIFLFALSIHSQAQTQHIRIITSADIHAAVFPFDYINSREQKGSMAALHAFIEEQRAEHSLILLDNGDILQGQPEGYFFSAIDTKKEHIISRALNYSMFDAATVGNHDIEAGYEVYKRVQNEMNMPWLGANVLHIKSGEPFFTPYTMIEREGISIAVIGLITPAVPLWLPRKLWESLEFVCMYETAKKYVQHIQENEKADAIIGLFHSGVGRIPSYGQLEPTQQHGSAYIAKYVPGFDLIFTAHDHRETIQHITNTEGKEVLLAGPKPHLESVAVVDLFFDKNNKLSKKEVFMQDLSEQDYSPQFRARFEEDEKAVAHFANQNLGYMTDELSSVESLFGNAPFTDLIHKIQLDFTGADISFAAPLSLNQTLSAGSIYMRDLFRLYPYENYLYIMEMTGAEVLGFLEHSYGIWYNQMESEEDRLLRYRTDSSGEIITSSGMPRMRNMFFNFDSASGIDYTVDVSKPSGERISVQQMSTGQAFQPEKTYRIAINSYRGSGGGGHLSEGAGIPDHLQEARIMQVSEGEMRSIIADYLKTHKELHPPRVNNWQIIPENRVQPAIEREMPLFKTPSN